MSSMAQSGGQAKFIIRTNSDWNVYTDNVNYWVAQWMNQNFNRLISTSPYWDSRLSWFQNTWVYRDLYGNWTGSDVARQHPDWILKDSNGTALYVPWGCWGSGCPNYAFDPGNKDFQNWWVQNAAQTLGIGYKGLWIDDVNMEYRIGYGDGSQATPNDPRTGQPMTYDAWKGYIADFTQRIRAGLPNAEIVHNSIWFGGGPNRDYDPNVIKEIQSADYINLERGISDAGLTNGNGSWSVNALLAFVDHVHSLGAHVIFDEYGFNGDYGIGGYFLVNDGRDGFGNQAVRPWYTTGDYSVNLGNPKGGRYNWNGMLRRDFDGGTVLVNPAYSNWANANIPGMKRLDGSSASNLWLNGGQGAILTY